MDERIRHLFLAQSSTAAMECCTKQEGAKVDRKLSIVQENVHVVAVGDGIYPRKTPFPHEIPASLVVDQSSFNIDRTHHVCAFAHTLPLILCLEENMTKTERTKFCNISTHEFRLSSCVVKTRLSCFCDRQSLHVFYGKEHKPSSAPQNPHH